MHCLHQHLHQTPFAQRTVHHLRGEPRLHQEKPQTGGQCYSVIECIHHKVYSGCTICNVTGFEKKYNFQVEALLKMANPCDGRIGNEMLDLTMRKSIYYAM